MIVKLDPSFIRSYFEDSSNLKNGHCDKVLIPENTDDVISAIKEANRTRTPITISGGGTATTGSRIPFGGNALSLEALNRIITIDKCSKTVTAQAGTLVESLKDACDKEGLFYTSHPTESTAFVGGTVATNASGSRSFKYGPTRKYVKRLKMVLATGDLIDIKRGEKFITFGEPTVNLPSGKTIRIPLPHYKMPEVKNAAGYYAKDGMDLIDLFIGQEGTLSVITEAEMALETKPIKIFSMFVFFDSQNDAWIFSDSMKRSARSGLSPNILSLEYFDTNALMLLRTNNSNVPFRAKAAIFLEEELDSPDLGSAAERWLKELSRYGDYAEDAWVAMNDEDVGKFSGFRYSIPEAVNDRIRKYGFQKLSTDIAVPDNAILEMMKFYESALGPSGIDHVVFGHIGENHVHANVIPHSAEELPKAQKLISEFIKKGIALGGTVAAEHGIGKIKHKYLEEMYGRSGILEMAKIKKAIDPNCLLGLDNIFPKELLKMV